MEDIRDPIIQKVVEQFISRSNVGFKKYKITLDEDSKTTYEWLQNIQEEFGSFQIIFGVLLRTNPFKIAIGITPKSPPLRPWLIKSVWI